MDPVTKQQFDILETLRARRGAQLLGTRPNAAFGFAYQLSVPAKLNEEDREGKTVGENDLIKLLKRGALDARYDADADRLEYRLTDRGLRAIEAYVHAQDERANARKRGRAKPGRE